MAVLLKDIINLVSNNTTIKLFDKKSKNIGTVKTNCISSTKFKESFLEGCGIIKMYPNIDTLEVFLDID